MNIKLKNRIWLTSSKSKVKRIFWSAWIETFFELEAFCWDAGQSDVRIATKADEFIWNARNVQAMMIVHDIRPWNWTLA